MAELNRTVTFDDENIVRQKLNYFKATEGQKYRIRIPLMGGIFMYSQHYSDAENAGYIRCLKDKDPDAYCPMCDKVDEPVTKFKINILEYVGVDSDGMLPEDLSGVSIVPKVLKCGIKVFTAIKNKHRKLSRVGGVTNVDLILECTNGQYQHLSVDDANDGCPTLEDPRLKAMADKLIAEKFINFETYQDRDSKFPTETQVQNWMRIVTGKESNLPKPEKSSAKQQNSREQEPELPEADTKAEGDNLLKDLGL